VFSHTRDGSTEGRKVIIGTEIAILGQLSPECAGNFASLSFRIWSTIEPVRPYP